MNHIKTASSGMQQEFMVTDAIINGSADDITAEIGDVAPGTIIYTAGFGTIKQKALDGSWAEVQ